MDCHFAYAPVASPLHDAAAVERLLAGLVETLTGAGGAATTVEAAPLDRPLVHVVLTGGSERLVLERLRQRSGSHRAQRARRRRAGAARGAPGSQLASRLPRDPRAPPRGRWHGADRVLRGDAGDGERLRQAVHLAGVAIALRRARLGAVGEPSEWLVASSHDAATVRATWGPEVVSLPIAELTGRLAAESPEPQLARQFLGQARASEVAAGAVRDASAVWRVLVAIVAEHRLSALTVRCFDLVTGPRTTGCLALSRLADDGVPAGAKATCRRRSRCSGCAC